MKLFEYEGKKLFQGANIPLPAHQQVKSVSELQELTLTYPLMVKPQTLSGKRGARGMITQVANREELVKAVSTWLGKKVDGETISAVLVEEKAVVKKEYYLAITYSTQWSGPVVLVSDEGGVDIESQKPKIFPIDILSDTLPNLNHGQHFQHIFEKLYACFIKNDLFLAEINPLVKTVSGPFLALDAKVITDDSAEFRQKLPFPPRNILGREKTPSEEAVQAIDAVDHRGVVGRVYLDLEGDIAILAAGGGASLVAMDALVAFGGKPANYTEFSGNPPLHKVLKLTQIVLKKPSLHGCFLVGGKANFTDQFETLKGFIDGVVSLKPMPKYPIVVRRDGPRIEEAFEYVTHQARKHGLNITLLDAKTSIIEAARIMVQKTLDYEKESSV